MTKTKQSAPGDAMTTEKQIDDGGPAYPIRERVKETNHFGEGCERERPGSTGISVRDWFAGMALTGLLSNPNTMDMEDETPPPDEMWRLFSLLSYAHADAMLRARKANDA